MFMREEKIVFDIVIGCIYNSTFLKQISQNKFFVIISA